MPKYLSFALAAMVIYSISTILHKKIPDLDSTVVVFIYSLVGTILMGIILLIRQQKFSPAGVAVASLNGVLLAGGFLLYIMAIRAEGSQLSIAMLIKNFSIVITIILAFIFFDESFTPQKAIGTVMGLVAIFLLIK